MKITTSSMLLYINSFYWRTEWFSTRLQFAPISGKRESLSSHLCHPSKFYLVERMQMSWKIIAILNTMAITSHISDTVTSPLKGEDLISSARHRVGCIWTHTENWRDEILEKLLLQHTIEEITGCFPQSSFTPRGLEEMRPSAFPGVYLIPLALIGVENVI